jgi:hypothetical protein
MKSLQDQALLPSEKYIRRVLEIDMIDNGDDANSADTSDTSEKLRLIVCMTQVGSERLLRAQYLQSDIGFKRVVGMYEFELACVDRDANTSEVYLTGYIPKL